MNDNEDLKRLFELARSAPANPDNDEAPYGFASRVVSRAWSKPDTEGLAWLIGFRWGAAAALAIMLICVGLNTSVLGPPDVSTDAVFHHQLTQLVLP